MMRTNYSALVGATALVAVLTAACAGQAPAEQQQQAAATQAPPTDGAATSSEAADFSGPVDIGERQLYLDCQGSAGPTVVFEAGMTGDHRTWEKVIPSLPPDARVCTYDRANIGRSGPAPTPRTAQDVVDDLEAALAAAGQSAPYVLVGFSFGGIFTQLYAAQHPDQVAGLVLVESNHPDEARDFWKHLTKEQIRTDKKETQANPEGIDVFASFDQVREARALPEVPLVVVTASRSEGWPPEWGDPKVFDELRAGHQADLASRVAGGEQVMAQGSGHHVPAERPTVVADAIRQVLGQ